MPVRGRASHSTRQDENFMIWNQIKLKVHTLRHYKPSIRSSQSQIKQYMTS